MSEEINKDEQLYTEDEFRTNVIIDAVNTFGIYQVNKAIEELGELSVALSHYLKTYVKPNFVPIDDPKAYGEEMSKRREDVIGEMADVLILLEQLKIFFEVENESLQSALSTKIRALNDILSHSKHYKAKIEEQMNDTKEGNVDNVLEFPTQEVEDNGQSEESGKE